LLIYIWIQQEFVNIVSGYKKDTANIASGYSKDIDNIVFGHRWIQLILYSDTTRIWLIVDTTRKPVDILPG
jgi:hypothetical protein